MKKRNLYLGKATAFNVMLKPIGPICNLDCKYCYYLEKKKLYPSHKDFTMPIEVLEPYLKQQIEALDIPVISFVWQGGEPSMLGLDYFKRAFEIQQKYAGNKKIENAFQTNGTLIDEEWCKFFHRHDVLVGISIDGPEWIHDKYRKYSSGKPSFARIMKSIELLKKHRCEFNTLSVVHNYNADYPLEVYHFLKEIGSGFLQFIPIVERLAKNPEPDELELVSSEYQKEAELTHWSVDGEKYGDFLIAIFDEWVRSDVGKYYVQLFDVTLANWVGEKPGLCSFSEICGDALVMEHNGDLYTCDHFVYPEELLGNIKEKALIDMAKSEKQIKFGEKKLNALPQQCIECEYRFACHGECPKNRVAKDKYGNPGLNHLCPGLYKFFNHVHPYMQFMADEYENERPPANVMQWVRKQDFRKSIRGGGRQPQPSMVMPAQEIQAQRVKVGRNDPCPCGSGKKYKNCCLNRF